MGSVQSVLWLLAAAIVLVAAFTDTRTGHIPNWLTLPPLLIGPLAYLASDGWRGLIYSSAGLLLCGLVPYLLWRSDGIGGGDVKLFAALGALLGWRLGLEAQVLSFVGGALLSVALLAYRRKLWRTVKNAAKTAVNPLLPKRLRRDTQKEPGEALRLGLSIMVATLLTLGLRLGGQGGVFL